MSTPCNSAAGGCTKSCSSLTSLAPVSLDYESNLKPTCSKQVWKENCKWTRRVPGIVEMAGSWIAVLRAQIPDGGGNLKTSRSCLLTVWPLSLQAAGFETIMLNSNPETVSTDYDTSDRLYFEPLTVEDVLNVIDLERPDGIIVQVGAIPHLTGGISCSFCEGTGWCWPTLHEWVGAGRRAKCVILMSQDSQG